MQKETQCLAPPLVNIAPPLVNIAPPTSVSDGCSCFDLISSSLSQFQIENIQTEKTQ